jgi:SAM-dependent methyltransferase
VLPAQCRLVEVGGGQIALLCRQMFGDEVVVWDLYDDYAGPFAEKGIGFARFDLLHDADPPESGGFDVAVLCEVVEHLPVPAHIALAKLARSLRPGGFLLITTPNLCRVRNIVRLALGRDIFCNWFLPERGQSLGHVTEFSPERLRWQAGRAGLEVVSLERVQFSVRASTLGATLGKAVCAPLSLVPRWREGLVMVCRRPEGAGAGQPDGVAS